MIPAAEIPALRHRIRRRPTLSAADHEETDERPRNEAARHGRRSRRDQGAAALGGDSATAAAAAAGDVTPGPRRRQRCPRRRDRRPTPASDRRCRRAPGAGTLTVAVSASSPSLDRRLRRSSRSPSSPDESSDLGDRAGRADDAPEPARPAASRQRSDRRPSSGSDESLASSCTARSRARAADQAGSPPPGAVFSTTPGRRTVQVRPAGAEYGEAVVRQERSAPTRRQNRHRRPHRRSRPWSPRGRRPRSSPRPAPRTRRTPASSPSGSSLERGVVLDQRRHRARRSAGPSISAPGRALSSSAASSCTEDLGRLGDSTGSPSAWTDTTSSKRRSPPRPDRLLEGRQRASMRRRAPGPGRVVCVHSNAERCRAPVGVVAGSTIERDHLRRVRRLRAAPAASGRSPASATGGSAAASERIDHLERHPRGRVAVATRSTRRCTRHSRAIRRSDACSAEERAVGELPEVRRARRRPGRRRRRSNVRSTGASSVSISRRRRSARPPAPGSRSPGRRPSTVTKSSSNAPIGVDRLDARREEPARDRPPSRRSPSPRRRSSPGAAPRR